MPRFMPSRTASIATLLLAGAAATVAYLVDAPAPPEPTSAAPALPTGRPHAPHQSPASPAAAQGGDTLGDAVRLFRIGYAGGLQIDEDTRSALDALVNALPESPSADDLARIEKSVRLSLPFEDAERVMKLVHGHIGYRREVSGLLAATEPPANADELRQLFARVDAIQQRHFATGDEALFGPRAHEARTLMEIMLVQQDATLTDAQKQARIEALQKPASPPLSPASAAGSHAL